MKSGKQKKKYVKKLTSRMTRKIRINNVIKIFVTYASAIAAPRSFPVSKKQLMTWRQLCNTKLLVCNHELHPPNHIQCHA